MKKWTGENVTVPFLCGVARGRARARDDPSTAPYCLTAPLGALEFPSHHGTSAVEGPASSAVQAAIICETGPALRCGAGG